MNLFMTLLMATTTKHESHSIAAPVRLCVTHLGPGLAERIILAIVRQDIITNVDNINSLGQGWLTHHTLPLSQISHHLTLSKMTLSCNVHDLER